MNIKVDRSVLVFPSAVLVGAVALGLMLMPSAG